MTAVTAGPDGRTGMLDVPGARLYHEVRGHGPALVLVPTGNGDAGPYRPLARLLADRFTVVSYDRRGFSRSPLDRPVPLAERVAVEADDVLALVEGLRLRRPAVFGTCTGGTIALAVLERHGHRGAVGPVVVHEPPVVTLLPEAAAEIAFHRRVYRTYRTAGLAAAMALFREYLGDAGSANRPPPQHQPPPDELAAMLARIRGSLPFWMEHDMTTFPAYAPDLRALAAAADGLLLVGGADSAELAGYRANAELAARLGLPLHGFPGAHLGHVTHPEQVADRLAALLAAHPR